MSNALKGDAVNYLVRAEFDDLIRIRSIVPTEQFIREELEVAVSLLMD